MRPNHARSAGARATAVTAGRDEASDDRFKRRAVALMGMLGWVMMGLAIWHFTIFLPDRFWGGIVGAFVGSLVGAIVVGLIIYGVKVSAFKVPGEKATDVAVVLYAIPGPLIGIALVYLEGMRRERAKIAAGG